MGGRGIGRQFSGACMAANAYHHVKLREWFKLGAKFEGIKRFQNFACYKMMCKVGVNFVAMERVQGGIQSMGMGGNIAMPPKNVCCHRSEACDENILKSCESLFDDTMIRTVVVSY